MNDSSPTTTIYLCAPVNALVEGIYKENIPLREVLEHGDFGLGTFNELDGEMIILNGQVYQITGTGAVNPVTDLSTPTPFACVTRFDAVSSDKISREMSYSEFSAFIDRIIPSPNLFYAFRIRGHFSYVKTRSVPRQENYRPLAEVAKEQATFEFSDVSGILAGFYTPTFMASVNVPGLHLHFLSDDRTEGGHLLECRPDSATAEIQFINNVNLSLPRSFDYLSLDFERDTKADLDAAEK